METQVKESGGRTQARAQAESIIAMVAALECDYDRLEELRANPEDSSELADLESAAGSCKDQDEARERIQEDALSVEVRADWHAPSELHATPSEFCILLCTGGPGVRILGELDEYQQPSRAWIEWCDWGHNWTEAFGDIQQSTLLTYCQQFYFGE